jgi:hypothetical protein
MLHVHHALDAMHIIKNVTESLLGTLLQSKAKGKDSLQCRMDLQDMKVRTELHPLTLPVGKKKLPVASWSLQTKEKERLLRLFHELKVPTGYSSNIRRIANMKDMKFNMSCLKAHNCHVIMTQLLPVAIKGVLSVKVRGLIIKLCSFFNAISHKVIDPNELKKL